MRLECNVTLYPPSSLFTTLKTAIQSIENITNNNFVELYEPIAIEGHYIMYFANITNIIHTESILSTFYNINCLTFNERNTVLK